MTEKPSRSLYLSVEDIWRLSQAMRPIEEAFGGTAWIVGSVLERDNWRDVDVRIILDDEDYGRIFHPVVNNEVGVPCGLEDQFRMVLQTAISGMLRQTTGLPIDFQVQSKTEANYYTGKRQPACHRPYIEFKPKKYKPRWMET